MAKKKTFNKKSFLISQLRRATYKFPPRNEALKKARVDRGLYKCAGCSKITDRHDIRMDHILPIVDPNVGFVDWNSYIERMFCDEIGYQALCNSCHDQKSQGENSIRKQTRAEANKKKQVKRKKERLKKSPHLKQDLDALFEEIGINLEEKEEKN